MTKKNLFLLFLPLFGMACSPSHGWPFTPACESKATLLLDHPDETPQTAAVLLESFLTQHFEDALTSVSNQSGIDLEENSTAYRLQNKTTQTTLYQLSFATQQSCDCVNLLDKTLVALQAQQASLEAERINQTYAPQLEFIDHVIDSLAGQIEQLETKDRVIWLDSLPDTEKQLTLFLEQRATLQIEKAGEIPVGLFRIMDKATTLTPPDYIQD